jgi:hypothetical protein
VPNESLDDLVERFVSCRIPKSEWTHHAHLAVGMWLVHVYGPDDALVRLRNGIKRLNDSHGTPNSEIHGYHETITRAYVEVLAQFLGSSSEPLEQRLHVLLNGPLAAHDLLLTFYRRDTLMSVNARKAWVEPDVAPISVRAVSATRK